MNGSTAAAELPGVCWEVGLFVRIKQNNRSMVYSDSPRCGPSAHLFLPLDLFFNANCCQITQEENAQLYIPAPGSLLWLLMSTPAVHLLWSCKCLLMASIRQVVGGGVVCVRLCVCVSVCVCTDDPNRPAAISPRISRDGSATRCHTPSSCRCKETVDTCTETRAERWDSAGLMQYDRGIIMKRSCCLTADLDWYSTTATPRQSILRNTAGSLHV